MKVSSINSTQNFTNFGAMKANQFKGIDYICMRKLKAPIEKFNSTRDFQRWAFEKIKEHRNIFPARTEKNDKLRSDLVSKWVQAFCWQPRYPFAFALVFLKEIYKNLKPTNDDLPDIYNPTALKQTYEEIKTYDSNNTQFRFLDVYKKHLKNIFDEDNVPENGWIRIDSLTDDPMNYEKNVTKLQVLSHRTWCTKAPYASTHLMYANFRLLMKDAKPQAIIRVMDNNVIEEIQSIGNNGPKLEDLPDIFIYIDENELSLSPNVKSMIDWVIRKPNQ